MKCDELRPVFVDANHCIVANDLGELYYKPEVDAAIAELKAENERLEMELEHVKNGDCINTCDVVEKYVQKLHDAEIALRVKSEDCVLLDEQIKRFERMRRQTLRALWLARAESAKNAVTNWCPECMQRWNKVECLCRAQAGIQEPENPHRHGSP